MFDNIAIILFIIAVLMIWVPWLTAHKIRPFFGKIALNKWLQARKHKAKAIEGLNIIDQIYQHTNAHKISQKYRNQNNLKEESFLYGEVYAVTFLKLMDLTHPKPGEHFYDLGSGSGKLVLLADYCYPFKSTTGIELLPVLHELSIQKLSDYQKLKEKNGRPQSSQIKFIQANFLEIDFTNANIIIINATAFKGEIFDLLEEKLKLIPAGARVIITSLPIRADEFEMIYSGHEVMSWGFCSVRIYKKL